MESRKAVERRGWQHSRHAGDGAGELPDDLDVTILETDDTVVEEEMAPEESPVVIEEGV